MKSSNVSAWLGLEHTISAKNFNQTKTMLGIDRQTGVAYEGLDSPEFPVWPQPVISLAKLILNLADRENLPSQLPGDLVFREDSFDAVTRVRRGRLYKAHGTQPQTFVVRASPFDDDVVKRVAASRELRRELFSYEPYQALLEMKNQGMGQEVAIGSKHASTWRIVQAERLANRNVLVTLKALTAFGILPDLDFSKIPPESHEAVGKMVDRAVDSAYRDIPTSVVDQCRNTANVVLGHWMIGNGAGPELLKKDLGEMLKACLAAYPSKEALNNAAFLINRMHSRGKENVRVTTGVRMTVDDDAFMALHALGFILRELDWVH